MAAKTDLAGIAGDHGFAVDVSEPDYFGEVRTTAVGEDCTIKLLHDRHGAFVSGYLMDNRGRTFRTTRIGDVKKWMGAA